MRTVCLVIASAALAACQQGSAPANEAEAGQAAPTQPVTLKAADGVTIYGHSYPAAQPRALVLLFHQAGSSSGEYATIAPKLAAAGYSALAIDQRAGGRLFGPNRTAESLGRAASYLDAKPDLEAALLWARQQGKPVILWGSSYSAALVFLVAAEHPGEVAAVLAFSPGEYLGAKGMVRAAADKARVPVLVATTEAEAPQAIEATGKTASMLLLTDAHGSSALIPGRGGPDVERKWRHVLAFLNGLKP